jgi:chloramphenicol O-acetyltransferase type A
LHPSFAHIRDGDDLFSLITLDFVDDLPAFDKSVREAIANTTEYFNIEKLKTLDDFDFISPLHWFSFTSIDHTLSLKRDDGIPRISWGKFFESNGKRLLPFNIHVIHMFVDEIHVGRFLDQLAHEISALATHG